MDAAPECERASGSKPTPRLKVLMPFGRQGTAGPDDASLPDCTRGANTREARLTKDPGPLPHACCGAARRLFCIGHPIGRERDKRTT